MAYWLKRLLLLSIAVLMLWPLYHGQEATAAGDPAIPIKVAVLYDSANPNANLDSTLYSDVVRVLNWNKLPFDSLDISGSSHPALLDGSGYLKYSAAIVQADGIAIDTINSQNILTAINQGMGAVSVMPTAANSLLKQAFGIATIGSQQLSAASLTLLKDKFTFAYAGLPVTQVSLFLDHTLEAGADVVATFAPNSQPAIWTYNYGAGKTVFHNTTATNTISYWGILLQSILYVMPIGVASPANVMALNVDDCPMTYYTPEYLQSYYHDFMTNYLRWLAAYRVKSTFYVSFSYSGSISDFWTNPQPVQATASILGSGNELGLHNGSQHLPLDPAYWGSIAGVDAEVNTTNQAFQTLREQMSAQYGLALGDIKSYVAPGNTITDYGYQTLNDNTTVKYLGESFAPGSGTVGAAQLQPAGSQTKPSAPILPDAISDFLKSGNNNVEKQSIDKMHIKKNANESIQLSLANQALSYPEVFKDFGWEGNNHIYNLPRIQSGFEIFNHPEDSGYPAYQNIIHTSLESGQPYIVFTHASEVDLTDKTKFPDATMASIFDGMSTWASYIAINYPYYRWMTSNQVGDFLSSRTGSLSATWAASSNTLQLTLAQPDDPVHIKTAKYLNAIGGSGSDLTLTFVDTPNNFQSDQYDVIKVANDYFIYPRGQKEYVPTIPDQPFVFQPVVQAGAPVLNAIGNKQVIAGQSLSFTVSGTDPDGDTLTYSASNLPSGATFNTSTHVFNWIPAAAGTYSGIVFSVSDGKAGASETIIITVAEITPTVEVLKVIAVGSDDGFSGNWGFHNALPWYEAGDPGAPYSSFFRFGGITIPKGATIVNAYLQTVQTGWTTGTKLTISGEKALAPGAPISTSNHAARVRTSAGVTWTSGYTDWVYHNSPDIAPVIQELVNAYDYSGGGTLQILVDNSGGTAGAECTGGTFESWTPPRLYIKYQTGSLPAQYTLTTGVSGNGTVTRNPNQAAYNSGVSVQLTALAAPGWSFSAWSGDLSGSINPATVNMIANKAVTAIFTQNPAQYTLTTGVSGNGTVTRNPNQAAYNSGVSVQLTALAAPGWSFSAWSGDLSGSINPATVSMIANKAITAIFTQNPAQYTLTTGVSGNGTVTMNPNQAAYNSGVSVQLTALAAPGWSFSAWSGDLSGSINPATVSMIANKAVTAKFTQNIVIAIASTVNPSVFGQSLTFVATAGPGGSNSGMPTGTTVFLDGGTTLGTGVLDASGRAVYSTGSLSVGTHSITVAYGGDSTFSAASSSALYQAVNRANTTTSLKSSRNPAVFGSRLTFTATVNVAKPGSGKATGTVTFKDEGVTLGVVKVNGSGSATYTVTSLPRGTHSISAVFSGDANFNLSTSPVLTQRVN